MDTPSPLIEYQAEIPDPLAFVRLFGTTSWDPEGRLTVAAAGLGAAAFGALDDLVDGGRRCVGTDVVCRIGLRR